MKERPEAITKVLTRNDVGETGGHQAGIVIPRTGGILEFFPALGNEQKNPRAALVFRDASGQEWNLNFIYYNNRFHEPKGTRNEYRLTGLTRFFRENNLKAGDTITLTHLPDGTNEIRCVRQSEPDLRMASVAGGTATKRLVIGTGWKVVKC